MQTDGGRRMLHGGPCKYFLIACTYAGSNRQFVLCFGRDSNGSTADHFPLHSSHQMTRGDFLARDFSDARTQGDTKRCIHDNTRG